MTLRNFLEVLFSSCLDSHSFCSAPIVAARLEPVSPGEAACLELVEVVARIAEAGAVVATAAEPAVAIAAELALADWDFAIASVAAEMTAKAFATPTHECP